MGHSRPNCAKQQKVFASQISMCRPLTKAQLDYARCDAHYLLYIAHKLYEELLAADAARPAHKGPSKLMQTWQRCQRVSLNLYTKHTSQVSPPAS